LRLVLRCEECRGRIAWTTLVHALYFAAGYADTGWRWQGQRIPIRTRSRADALLVDVECFRCGWSGTYALAEALQVAS
jgi:hypothetical protein